MVLRQSLALLLLTMIVGGAQARPAHNSACSGAPVEQFLSAWGHADARSIAALFLTDADLVIPTGQLFSGADTIRAFYQNAFDSGYAASSAEAAILQARLVSTGVCLLDGTWKIRGARHADGPAADESGVFSALLVYERGVWKISALREQSSAEKLDIIRSLEAR
jgi:uncharacterized protein (TIGR02246 family)